MTLITISHFDHIARFTKVDRTGNFYRAETHPAGLVNAQSRDESQPIAGEQYAIYPDTTSAQPAFPISAPASSANLVGRHASFDAPHDAQRPDRPPLSHHHQHSLSQTSLPSYTSEFSDIGLGRSSAGHSRSASVASTSFSHGYNPKLAFSMSTPSSAASSFGGESGSSSSASFLSMTPNRLGSTKTRGHRLTDADRRLLCEFHTQNPKMKHENIGHVFGIERSTVSKILKNKSKWQETSETVPPRYQNRFDHLETPLPSSEAAAPPVPLDDKVSESPAEGVTALSASTSARTVKKGRHPELEAALAHWGREQTAASIVLTDEQVQNKAKEIAASMGLEPGQFKASAGWLENFRLRAGYKAGRFSLDALSPQLQQAQQSFVSRTDKGKLQAPRPLLRTLQPQTHTQTSDSGLGYYGSDWAQPDSSSSGGWISPLDSSGSRATGNASGSSSSIAGLGVNDGTGSMSQATGLSAPFSRYIHREGASYSSAESSPFPSPIDGLDAAQQSQVSSATSAYSHPWSTPIQEGSGARPDSAASSLSSSLSPGYRLQHAQQAGIAFQLSLDASYNQGQGIELPSYDQPPDARMAFQETAEMAGDSARSVGTAKPSYSLRSRFHSVGQPPPGSGGRSRQISQPSPLSMSDGNLQEFPMMSHQPHEERSIGISPHTGSLHPPKIPLHRSNTDPMPLAQGYSIYSQDSQSDPHVSPDYQYHAQVSSQPERDNDPDRPSSDETTRHSQAGFTNEQRTRMYEVAQSQQPQQQPLDMQEDAPMDSVLVHGTHPPAVASELARSASRFSPAHGQVRRATVSSGSPSDAHGGVHRLSGSAYLPVQAVTPTFGQFGALPRGVDLNEPVSFDEAYLALRKVVGYVHASSTQQRGTYTPSSAGSATVSVSAVAASHQQYGSAGGPKVSAGQMQVLEGLLGQFWDTYVARQHSLTPPSSQ